jgi:predicted transcriptional regulator
MKLLFPSGKKRWGALSGELERPIMEILWSRGAVKGRDLYETIRMEKSIAYTTALTVLDRLSKKNFVKKNRASETILFSPAISKDAYESAVTGELVRRAFGTSPDMAVSAFADVFSRMPRAELERLEALIEEKKNGRRK